MSSRSTKGTEIKVPKKQSILEMPSKDIRTEGMTLQRAGEILFHMAAEKELDGDELVAVIKILDSIKRLEKLDILIEDYEKLRDYIVN